MNNDRTNAQEASYTFTEVAYHFQVTPEVLRSWIRRFAQLLSPAARAEPPRFTSADVAALITVQKLLEQGLQDDQINAQLTPKRIVSDESAAVALSTDQARQLVEGKAALLPQALGDILATAVLGAALWAIMFLIYLWVFRMLWNLDP
jgi:DNA-binding transcriptional MerR regulator